MPTDAWFEANPKVSAYIPKQLNERLKQFKEEQSLSVSQAVTIILSNYFGVDQQVNQLNALNVNSERIEQLEQKVTMLSESVDQRFREREEEFININGKLIVNQSKLLERTSSLNSEPKSRLKKEQQSDQIILAISSSSDVERLDRESVLPNELLSKPIEGESVLPNELLSRPIDESDIGDTQVKWQDANVAQGREPLGKEHEKIDLLQENGGLSKPDDEPIPGIKPLSGVELGKRLKASHSIVTRYKNGKRKQSLTEWSKSLDPDGVSWEYSEEQKKYIPLNQGKPDSVNQGSLQSELLEVNSDGESTLREES